MVVFCMHCGVSLPPFVPTVIKDGKERPSPYYICLSCGKEAGRPNKPASEEDDLGTGDIVIKDGKVEKK